MATPNGLARIEAHGEKKDENGVCHEDDSALPVRAQTIDELHSLQRKRSAPTSAALSDDSEEKHHRQQMQSISTTAAAQRTGSSPPVDVVMAMRKRNHGNDNWRNNTAAGAVVGAGARQLLRQALEDAPPTVLLGVGFVTSVAAVRAAASLAYPAYLGSLAVAGALFGGLGTMWAAGWVAADPARRRDAGRVLLCASLVPMVVAVGLSADYRIFFDMLRAVVAFVFSLLTTLCCSLLTSFLSPVSMNLSIQAKVENEKWSGADTDRVK